MSALREPSALLTQYQPAIHGLGLLDINYHELKCLEMAVYFLITQLNQTIRQKQNSGFAALRDYHVRNIEQWLSNRSLRAVLRFDATNSVLWPVVSSEDAFWLIAALKVGLSEKTITAMASDDTHFERDMRLQYADSAEVLVPAESHFDESFQAFYHYYAHIATYHHGLIDKLKAIVMD